MAKDFSSLPILYFDAGFLPRLFLQKSCLEELVDLIVLDPQWLMTVMKVIMELTVKDDVAELSITQLQMLVTDGVADFEVFEACWKKLVSAPPGFHSSTGSIASESSIGTSESHEASESSSAIELHHLVLILQAYCLLYPVQSIAMHGRDTAETDSQQSVVQKYIIPCKLPDNNKISKFTKNYRSFYVDFCQFLPDEIYHRLMCLASSQCQIDPYKFNSYSKRSCSFFGLRGSSNWNQKTSV